MSKVHITSEEDGKVEKDNDNDSEINDLAAPNYLATRIEIYSLGVGAVLGGQLYGWEAAFQISGFGTYAIAQILMGLAYICLVFCIAEINATIPFSGGAFGLARVCLGFYPGFIIGCLELIEYIAYTSAVVVFLGQQLGPYLGVNVYFQWPIWLLFYFITTLIVLQKDIKYFWNFVVLLATIGLGLVMIYVFGSLSDVNFEKWAAYVPYDDFVNATTGIDTITLHDNQSNSLETTWFIGGMTAFLRVLPLTTWAYGGIESLSLTVAYVKEPKKNLPIAFISAMITLFITSVLLLFVVASMSPGVAMEANMPFPMNYGYNRIFSTDDNVSNNLIVPAQFAMGFGFIFPSGRLFYSLGQSNLLPSWLGLQHNQDLTRSVIYVQIVGLLVCLLSFYIPSLSANLNNIAILAGFLTYFSQLIGYMMLQGRFKNIEREFRSILGLPGAIFASIIFLLGTIAVMAFQNDDGAAFLTNLAIVVLLTVYYFCGPVNVQILSKEENTTLFRMNIINANIRKKRAKSFRWMNKKLLTVRRLSKIMLPSQLESFMSQMSIRTRQSSTAPSHAGAAGLNKVTASSLATTTNPEISDGCDTYTDQKKRTAFPDLSVISAEKGDINSARDIERGNHSVLDTTYESESNDGSEDDGERNNIPNSSLKHINSTICLLDMPIDDE